MLNVFFLISFLHAEDLDRDALSAMAGGTAKLASVNPTVSSSGKNPPCPPQVNALTPTIRSQCPNAEKYPAKAFPTQIIKGAGDQDLTVSVVSEDEAQKIFRQVKNLNLPWGSSQLCVQRALIMGFCLEHAMKLHVAKIIADRGYLSGPMTSLCDSESSKKGKIWSVHQAVTVMVKLRDGSVKPYVVDPATMDKAASREEWESCLSNIGSISIGAPNAINWEEASMTDPPAFNVDKFHDIDVSWRTYPHP